MWVLIDHYDSFTYILQHYLLQLHRDVRVFKHDQVTMRQLIRISPQRIILSPGPGTPAEAAITNDIIACFYDKIPILGVCLGHQALGLFFGAKLQRAVKPMHGKVSLIQHQGVSVFKGMPAPLPVMRYHSLILSGWEKAGLCPLAMSVEGELMAFRHPDYPVLGIQFHPESIQTEYGFALLENWLTMFS